MAGPKLTEQLGYIIASVNRRLEEDLAERLRPGGIAIEQFRIIEALSQTASLSMGELAALVLVESATLTKIIDRMVADQVVFRMPDAHDRRKVQVALTGEGRVLYRRLSGVAQAHERRISDLLDAEGVTRLRSLLMELREV